MAVPSGAEAAEEEEEVDEEVQEGEEGAVGGLREVVVLARTLVGLRNEDVLTHQQEQKICREWQRLAPRDKERISYPPRHQKELRRGRFRSTKRPSGVPGTDSVKR